MSEQKKMIKTSKLSYFRSFFLGLDIDIEELNIENYPLPSKRWKTVVDFVCSKEKEVDIKQNAIYSVLESVLEKCETLIDIQENEEIKDIILAIASTLYDKKFINSIDNEKIIIETIKWSNNTDLIKKLSLFTCLYLNASNNVCSLISETALYDAAKLNQFYVNSKILSKNFIKNLKKYEHEQIIKVLITSKRTLPLLNEELYKYIRNFCDYDFSFFLNLFKYTPFFLASFEDILKVFGLEQLKNMSLEKIRFLCYFRDINSLIKIKILLDLNVPLKQIEKVLKYPFVFELIILGLPISKIDKVIHYPNLINYIYQKIIYLGNNKTSYYDEYRSLIKTS